MRNSKDTLHFCINNNDRSVVCTSHHIERPPIDQTQSNEFCLKQWHSQTNHFNNIADYLSKFRIDSYTASLFCTIHLSANLR